MEPHPQELQLALTVINQPGFGSLTHTSLCRHSWKLPPFGTSTTVRPIQGRNMTFLYGPALPNHSLVHTVYSAKWDNDWVEQYCYQIPSTLRLRDFAHSIQLEEDTLVVLHNRRLVQDESLQLRHGDSLEIEIDEQSDEESDNGNSNEPEDCASLMQSPSTSTPHGGDVTLTLRGTHGLLHTLQIPVEQSLYAYLDEHWPFPSHQPTDLAALHAVSAPPSYVRSDSEQIFLVELNSDRFDQVHPDDVLLLLTVRYFVSGAAWTSDKVKTRVLWGPKKATREQALQFLRMQWHCRSEVTTCDLLFNEVVWAIHDTALYNFESGDHLRLNIKSTRDNWCEFTFSEQADRERRVLESSPSSPPAEQEGPESEEADLSPYTIQEQPRSRSRSRSLIQRNIQTFVANEPVQHTDSLPEVPNLQCRPNTDITDIMDFDDYVPYDRQFPNGDHFSGRVITPHQWQDHPFVRAASDHGAVHRDPHNHLYVNCRTWFATHTGPAVHQHRDLTIRAQLLIQLTERVRRLWRDLLLPADWIRVYLVNPMPAPSRHEEPRIHILVECNRPNDSDIRPILMSFQQISAMGLAEHLMWRPLLSPPALTLDFLQDASLTGCLSDHFLVPIAARVRGWLQRGQQRHVAPGAYIPAWYDLRRPTQSRSREQLEREDAPETDADSLLQIHQGHKQDGRKPAKGHPHVSDRWCGGPEQTCDPSHPVTKCDFAQVIGHFEWLDTHLLLPTFSFEAPWQTCSQSWLELPWYVPDATCHSLWIYFDGSHLKNTDTSGAGVAAFADTTWGWRLCGFLSTPLASGSDAYGAEAYAALVAVKFAHDLLKLHSTHRPTPPAVHLIFDNTSVGQQTIGNWASNKRPSIGKAIRHLVQTVEKRFSVNLETHHVYGHTGDPGNEIVDILAKEAAEGRATNDLQDFLAHQTDEAFLHSSAWFWILFRQDLADFWNGHVLHMPAQPTTTPSPDILDFVEHTKNEQQQKIVHLKIKMATANVLSLKAGSKKAENDAWGPARQELLLQQFHEHGFQLFAMQETRIKRVWRDMDDRYVIIKSPATDHGHYGIAICLSKQIPHGSTLDEEGNSTPICFRQEDISIVAIDPRFLIIRVVTDALKCLVIGCHAPHSGADEETRSLFWARILSAIQPKYSHWPKLLLADLNSRLGSEISEVVGPYHAEPSNGKEHSGHEFLMTARIWLPATFESCQIGAPGTWQHTNGQWARNDFVGLPQDWAYRQCQAWVENEIDLSLQKTDHCVAAVSLEAFFQNKTTPRTMRLTLDEQTVDSFVQTGQHIAQPDVDWYTDVHTHADRLQQAVCETLWKNKKKQPFQKKKTLTPATWSLVCKKREVRSHLSQLNYQQRCTSLALFFNMWAGTKTDNLDQFNTIIKNQDKLVAQALAEFRQLGREVTAQVRRDDTAFYQHLAEEAAHFTAPTQAKRFWQVIRRSLPNLRSRRQGYEPLQMDGLEDKWNPHFQALEIGEEVEGSRLVRECHEFQISRPPLDHVDLRHLPSLSELEDSLRNTRAGKSTGFDEIPSLFFHQCAPKAAEFYFDLIWKFFIKGYRPCRRPLMVFYGRRRRNHETIAGGYGQLGDQCAVCEPFSAL